MSKPIQDEKGRIKIPNSNTFISPEMIEDIIQMSEDAITNYKIEQSKIQDPLLKAEDNMREAYDMYAETKREYDKLKGAYDDYEEAIKRKKNIIALHNHIKSGKPLEKVKVYEKISNNVGVKPKKPRAEKINWLHWAVQILKDENKFYKPLDLMDRILKVYPEIKKEFESQTKHDRSKLATLAVNFVKHASREQSQKGRPILLKLYGEKLGLVDFFDEKGNLKPQYLNQFMG